LNRSSAGSGGNSSAFELLGGAEQYADHLPLTCRQVILSASRSTWLRKDGSSLRAAFNKVRRRFTFCRGAREKIFICVVAFVDLFYVYAAPPFASSRSFTVREPRWPNEATRFAGQPTALTLCHADKHGDGGGSTTIRGCHRRIFSRNEKICHFKSLWVLEVAGHSPRIEMARDHVRVLLGMAKMSP
jgi:hypothetical protein